MVRWLAILAVFLGASASAQAMGFYMTPTTWRTRVSEAQIIICGTLCNPRPDPEIPSKGTTDCRIDKVLKAHPFIPGPAVVRLPRLLEVDADKPRKYIVFLEIYKDRNNR